MLPFGERGGRWYQGGGEGDTRLLSIQHLTFFGPFLPPDTIPVYDPPPTGDGHIYVQFTVTSTNGLVKHVLASSLSKGRPATH